MADIWVVVEYNQASQRPEDIYGPYDDEDEAGEAAADRAFNTFAIGRGERFQIARLVFNDEIYDPDHYADVSAQIDGSMAPCGHRDDDPLDPAASPGELSHPDAERLEDGAAPSTHNDGSECA